MIHRIDSSLLTIILLLVFSIGIVLGAAEEAGHGLGEMNKKSLNVSPSLPINVETGGAFSHTVEASSFAGSPSSPSCPIDYAVCVGPDIFVDYDVYYCEVE